MLEEFQNIYQAKIELFKLEGIERTSGILARMTSVLLVALLILVGSVAALAIISIFIGFWIQNGRLAVMIFTSSLLVGSVILILFRHWLIIKPLNNMLINMFYEELP